MYLMGMNGFSYYFSWFLRYFIVYLVIFIIEAIILSSVLKYIPFYVVLIVNIPYGLALIAQLYFIQVFTTRAKVGVLFAVVAYIFQYGFSLIATNPANSSLFINALVSIAPHSAIVLAYRTLVYC